MLRLLVVALQHASMQCILCSVGGKEVLSVSEAAFEQHDINDRA